MRKIFALFLALTLIITACGCSGFGFKTAYSEKESDNTQKIIISDAEFIYQILTTYSNLCALVDSYDMYYETNPIDFDKTVTPDEQNYTDDDSDENLYETWMDYITDTAYCAIQERKALCSVAKENGIKLDENDLKKVDALVEDLKKEFINSSGSEFDADDFEDYLKVTYGDGMNIEILKTIQEEALLADKFENAKREEFYNSYSDNDIEEFYNKNLSDYGAVDVTVIPFEYTSENKADMQKKAEKIFDTFATNKKVAENDDTKILTAANAADLYALDQTGKLKEWSFDTQRKDGDREIIETSDSIFVIFMVRKNYDIYAYNSRHILFKVNNKTEWESVSKEAQNVFDTWKNGPATEESFIKLVEKHSEDTGSLENGGLYENVQPGELVSQYEEWCLDSERQPGDVGIVKVEGNNYNGYHIIYFKSLNSTPAWVEKIRSEKSNEDYNKYSTGLFEKECNKYIVDQNNIATCIEDALLRIKLLIEKK